MNCPICNHPDRALIEQSILNMSTDNKSITLKSIVDTYSKNGSTFTEQDLKVHALMHTPLGVNESDLESDNGVVTESLTRKIKLQEADMLRNVANEYMVTLKNMGRKINKFVSDDDDNAVRLISKSMADMYLGLGGEIRATVKTLADLDQQLNGPANNSNSGIDALAAALIKSKEKNS